MISDSPTSHIYFSQRLRLHYVGWGNEDAPLLLMVHGGRDHCRNWDWVAHELRKDFHIIVPDLRGHGDSQWMVGSSYSLIDYVFDIAQLLRKTRKKPVTIMGHSLGGAIALLYTALYPEFVSKVIAIEGIGPLAANSDILEDDRLALGLRGWISHVHGLSARIPHRYPTLKEAFERMRKVNKHLTEEQARHLTIHGSNQNEDGTYSWKFDNYVRTYAPVGLDALQLASVYRRISCPTLMVHGKDSWLNGTWDDGRAAAIPDVRIETVENAGHWVHHDQLDVFLQIVRQFLQE